MLYNAWRQIRQLLVKYYLIAQYSGLNAQKQSLLFLNFRTSHQASRITCFHEEKQKRVGYMERELTILDEQISMRMYEYIYSTQKDAAGCFLLIDCSCLLTLELNSLAFKFKFQISIYKYVLSVCILFLANRYKSKKQDLSDLISQGEMNFSIA